MTRPPAAPGPDGRYLAHALALHRGRLRRQLRAVRDWRRCRPIYRDVLDVDRIVAAEEAELAGLWRRYTALTRRRRAAGRAWSAAAE